MYACYFCPLTGQVDLVKEVVSLRYIIKRHAKHWLLWGVESPVFLSLATNKHAGQDHSTTPNYKLWGKREGVY